MWFQLQDDFLVCFDFNFPHLPHFRKDKIAQLCSVMDVKRLGDPDEAYELTADNVKKILAIHMRFRYALIMISIFLHKPSDGLLTVEKILFTRSMTDPPI